MSPEMPFPIGSTVANIVKIKDSAGNTIGSSGGKLYVFPYGNIDVFQQEASGELKVSEQNPISIFSPIAKYVRGTIDTPTIVLTVPAGKKIILRSIFGDFASNDWLLGIDSSDINYAFVIAVSLDHFYKELFIPVDENGVVWIIEDSMSSGKFTLCYTEEDK